MYYTYIYYIYIGVKKTYVDKNDNILLRKCPPPFFFEIGLKMGPHPPNRFCWSLRSDRTQKTRNLGVFGENSRARHSENAESGNTQKSHFWPKMPKNGEIFTTFAIQQYSGPYTCQN